MAILGKIIMLGIALLKEGFENLKPKPQTFTTHPYAQKIKEDWVKVRVPSDRIDVLETNMNIRLEDPGRYEDPIQELKRITVYYYPDINGEKREYKQTLQDVDKTVFEFKMHANGYIDLYFSNKSYSKFYADLSFLDQEIAFK